MAITMTYTNPRRTHLQVNLSTGTDVLGPLTGPVVTTIAADGSYPTYQAIVAGGGGGVPAIVYPWANQLPGVPPT